MKRRSGFLVTPLLVIAAAVCGSTSIAAPPNRSQPVTTGTVCPAGKGIHVVSATIPGGVALEFTTTGDVAALRSRVREMAEMRNRMMGSGMGMHGGGMQGGMMGSGEMGSGGMHGGMGTGGMMRMVPSHASVEDIAGGARLVLTPVDPSQLGALRAHANRMAAMMQQGHCPMMQSQAPAAPREPASPGKPAGA